MEDRSGASSRSSFIISLLPSLTARGRLRQTAADRRR